MRCVARHGKDEEYQCHNTAKKNSNYCDDCWFEFFEKERIITKLENEYEDSNFKTGAIIFVMFVVVYLSYIVVYC